MRRGSPRRMLERAERNDPTMNGFILSELLDLEARESAEIIERAYAGDLIDDSICGTWYDVWHRLGLEGDPPPRTERKYTLEELSGSPPRSRSELLHRLSSKASKQEARRVSPARRPQGTQQRPRQKLEKKLKGKRKRQTYMIVRG